MTVLAAILLFALTRAELLDRLKADPVVRLEGMVRVVGDCPEDMHREYMLPVAIRISDICSTLYRGESMRPQRFTDSPIVVHLGDVRTNLSNVAVLVTERKDRYPITKMYIPAPGFADIERIRNETVKAFYRAVKGEEIDDETALARLRAADPELRAADKYAELESWLAGEKQMKDDEHFLALMRSVLRPGVARESDVLRFASRLRIYPALSDIRFCGRFASCSFSQAVEHAAEDPRIRIAAFEKAPLVIAYGGGRG